MAQEQMRALSISTFREVLPRVWAVDVTAFGLVGNGLAEFSAVGTIQGNVIAAVEGMVLDPVSAGHLPLNSACAAEWLGKSTSKSPLLDSPPM